MGYKAFIRQILNFFHLDLTKNLEYDRLTKLIMKKVIKSDSNCVDVGCHKGEILEDIIKLAPNGKHFAFEPIPLFFDKLKARYNGNVSVLPYALSDKEGESSFQFVKNAPAYSGLEKRKYSVDKPDIEEIKVELKSLDSVVPESQKIDFIKIDVEGGEYDVLKGAKRILKTNKPTIIFEFGKGASEYYGTIPEDLFSFVNEEVGLRVFLLKDFIKEGESLSKDDFISCYQENCEYYFVASP